MKIMVSHHARKRMRKRLGIKSKAVIPQATRAFWNGEIVDHQTHMDKITMTMHDYYYVFGYDQVHSCPLLITVFSKK